MTHVVVAPVVLALAMLTAGLGGCSATTSGPPPDVRISVYQPRPDVAENRIAIVVHNDGATDLTVTSARLRSSFFGEPFDWGPDRTATVPPGYAVDLRVDIPTAVVCDDAPPEHSVEFAWHRGDDAGVGTVSPEDPFHLLDLLRDAACLIQQVDAVATLTAASLTAPPGLPAPADLLIEVAPTGLAGTITLDSVHSTTLLDPAGPDGIGVPELAFGIPIDADGPSEVHIPLVPNRCDAHALAEDKVGTRIPLSVTAPDGTSGRYVLGADDDLRAQMYAFFSAYCGL